MTSKKSRKDPAARKRRMGLDDDTLGGGRPDGHVAAEARDVGMRTENRGGRHDTGYIPSGHELAGGKLRQTNLPPPPTIEDVRLVRWMAWRLRTALGEVGFFLSSVVTEHDLAEAARHLDPALLNGVRRLYREVFGTFEAWQPLLARELHRCALIREHRRLGLDPGEDEPTPSEILATITTPWRVVYRNGEIADYLHPSVPDWLTPRAIEALIPKVNLGGKGGRGKRGTAEQVVEWAVRRLGNSPR